MDGRVRLTINALSQSFGYFGPYFLLDLVWPAAGRAREKGVFLVVPRRTNPNKHLLGGLVFLGELDASNPN